MSDLSEHHISHTKTNFEIADVEILEFIKIDQVKTNQTSQNQK